VARWAIQEFDSRKFPQGGSTYFAEFNLDNEVGVREGKKEKWEKGKLTVFSTLYSFPLPPFPFFPSLHKERLHSAKIFRRIKVGDDADFDRQNECISHNAHNTQPNPYCSMLSIQDKIHSPRAEFFCGRLVTTDGLSHAV
jgi:hypothetical protein